jgi:hypothetical protein
MSEEAFSRSAAPHSQTSYGSMDGAEPSRPKISYGMQLNAESSDLDHQGGSRDNETQPDWLAEKKICLIQDLDTSKKELDIIRFILEEMGLRLQTEQNSDPNLAGQVELMRACREHSTSRCHLLRERLRQIRFWSHTRMLGQQVPEKAPEEVSSCFFPEQQPNGREESSLLRAR